MAVNSDDHEDNEEQIGEQVRVSFVLDSSVSDRSLEVPSEPIAIPADLRRKGLSAVINHLLDRGVDSNSDSDDDEEEDKLKALPFDFIIANRLLRTGVETAARRHGLSLEQAIRISYFPAQEAPEESNEGEPVPDWIAAIAVQGGLVCTGGYDGSVVLHEPTDQSLDTIASMRAHTGPIKCLATMEDSDSDNLMIATGSLDQSLVTHLYDQKRKKLVKHANFVGGHTASIGSVDILASRQTLVSGDWDGGLCLWDLSNDEDSLVSEELVKKRKTGATSKSIETVLNIQPMSTFQAHASQISDLSWGNSPQATGKTLITGSWDHSLKVWDVERQDCLLTLNGSRVISCLDTSYHSEVVATGHPDCTIRLWDVRTSDDASSSLVSDSSLKPSHKAWVSAVKWSPKDPYVLASTSHDGTIKIWDIRSPLPLHTVRAHPKGEKGLCLAFGDGAIFSGGSDCVVRQFRC